MHVAVLGGGSVGLCLAAHFSEARAERACGADMLVVTTKVQDFNAVV